MRTQGSRLPKTLTETHRGCSPGTSQSLQIYPLRSAGPEPPQRRVLGAPSCPAAVTARSGDALSFSRVRASVRPSEAVAALRLRSGAKWQPRVLLRGNLGDGRRSGHPHPHPRGRRTAPNGVSLPA